MPEAAPPTETAVPEVDTSKNGEAIATAIGAVSAAIAAIVGTAATTELQKLANPCIRLAILENRLVRAQRGLDRMIGGVNFFAEACQASVIDSIENWGESGGNSGGKAFPFWLLESGAITHAPEAIACYSGPLLLGIGTAGCLVAISNGLPSDGSEQPSSSNNGYRLGAGLYRYPGPGGTFRGTRFVSEWSAWKRFQTQNVYSIASGRPNWKARLVSWVGRSTDSWRTWTPGSPIDPNSLIGRRIAQVEGFAATVAAERVRCNDQEDVIQALALGESERLDQMVLNAGTGQTLAAELQALEIASSERVITNAAIAGVLSLALVALWSKK